ncbi:MAG: penicillin-binding transpeptidase domain-containing protein [Xanthomonadales bacterium]|nr:penicillin-binding transpeptidase domain-containing protein [Xanthomonadales bacterium]
MRGTAAGLLLAALAAIPGLPAFAASPTPTPDKPLETHFEGFSACALVLHRDRHDEWLVQFSPERCALPLSPCSTFKIPHALIGLQTGVISGPDHARAWDGIERERAVTNRDHTLASAIQESVPWYFQSVAREIGPERMTEWLARLDYGNQDISAGIDQFWLGTSLEIDAHDQLELLKRLRHGALPFEPEHQATVRELLTQDSPLPGRLHGKTGSCRGLPGLAGDDHGWFVGWLDHETPRGGTTWFVVNLRGESAWGWIARERTLALLADLLDMNP